MALDRYGDSDDRLGKKLASGTGSAFVPAMMLVDAAGNTVGSSNPSTAVYRLVSSAATDNATNATNAGCTLRHVIGKSSRASDLFLKLYDKATAPASTDAPKLTIPVPPGGVALDFPEGIQFTNGLGYRLTTGSADNDTGAVAAGDLVGLNLVVA